MNSVVSACTAAPFVSCLHIQSHIYQALAEALSEKIADRNYLPMTMLEVEDEGDLLFRFVISAVIYRREESFLEGGGIASRFESRSRVVGVA